MWRRRRECSRDRIQDSVEVFTEAVEGLKPFGRRVNGLGLSLKDLASVVLDQDTHDFAHPPTGSADNFEALRRGAQECDAAVAENADAGGKALEGLQFETGEVELLKLLRGVGHKGCG